MTQAFGYAVDGIALGAIDALIALGLAVVFGLLRLVNFAHGDLVTTGAYAMFVFSGLAFPLVIPLMLIVVVVVALLLERVAFRPLRRVDPMTLLVTSFSLSYLLQNLDIIAFSSRPKSVSVPSFLGETFSVGTLDIPKLDVVSVALTLVLLLSLRLFLSRTSLGLQMVASASDFTMARLLGVRANRVIASAFAISGILAAAVSFVLISQLGNVSPQLGVQPVLIGFAAVIIGGIGSLVGASVGGFLLGFTTIMLQAYLPQSLTPFRDAFLFMLVIVFLLFRPQGLVPGRYSRERA
jgi:branched-chain amino acid transport system permease protein